MSKPTASASTQPSLVGWSTVSTAGSRALHAGGEPICEGHHRQMDRSRALWHVHGMLLWLLQRPALRYVPFPYPSVGTVSQWKDASRADGFASMPPITADGSSTQWELHNEELGRRDLASRPNGHQAQLHGEPARGRNAGSNSQQGTCDKDEAKSHGRGVEAGGPGNRRGQTGRGCKGSTWSWSSFTSSRPSSSGRLSQGAHPGEGDGRADQAGVQTNGGSFDDQDQ